MNLLNDKLRLNMAEYVLNMEQKQLQLQTGAVTGCKLQTKHSMYESSVQRLKRRKRDNEVLEKWEKIVGKKENILPHVTALHSPGGKELLLILSDSRREMRKIPFITDDKDNVIARLTVLGYMMFVSLETSPLERRQG